MNRREALKKLIGTLSVGAFAGLPAAAASRSRTWAYGAIAPTTAQRRQLIAYPSFHQKFAPLKGISKDSQNVFLWKNLEKELGVIVPHNQTRGADGAEAEGDCLGHSSAMGCDVLAATEIHMLGQRERWNAKASVEAIYWGSRCEIGKAQMPPSEWAQFRRGGGSVGYWAAEWLKQYGVLHRQVYAVGEDSYDLTGYDPGRSRELRNTGVPDWLEPIAKEHPVLEISQPKSGQEALDAICAGQPVVFCSSYAFHNTRDAEGFCLPFINTRFKRQRGRLIPWNQWFHAMIATGALLEGGRVGILIQNSHGVWNSGPQPHGIPDGSFFVDLQYADVMVKDWNDCWALSGYMGHEATQVRKHLLYIR
jgi:hypothetical protein